MTRITGTRAGFDECYRRESGDAISRVKQLRELGYNAAIFGRDDLSDRWGRTIAVEGVNLYPTRNGPPLALVPAVESKHIDALYEREG